MSTLDIPIAKKTDFKIPQSQSAISLELHVVMVQRYINIIRTPKLLQTRNNRTRFDSDRNASVSFKIIKK